MALLRQGLLTPWFPLMRPLKLFIFGAGYVRGGQVDSPWFFSSTRRVTTTVALAFLFSQVLSVARILSPTLLGFLEDNDDEPLPSGKNLTCWTIKLEVLRGDGNPSVITVRQSLTFFCFHPTCFFKSSNSKGIFCIFQATPPKANMEPKDFQFVELR